MTREELVGRARALAPALRERARAAELLRRLPEETLKDFQEAGLLYALRPARYGGHELEPHAFFEAVAEVARACPSSAWVLGVVGVHEWQLALFEERAQDEVWGEDRDAYVSSSYAPTGEIELADGGYRVSGRWSFSSGCDICRWVFLGGFVPGDGPPDMRTFLLPRSDYEIDDNWEVSGLCATGSKDIVVDGAFVPEHRTHKMVDGFRCESPGNAIHSGPSYRLPFATVFASALAAPAIGAAQGALDAFREQTRARESALDRARVAEDPFNQKALAVAAAEIDAVRARLDANFDEMMELVRAGREIPLDKRARYRWNAADATSRCMRAVDGLMERSGGRGIFLDNPIQRAFRDLHAMRAHAINNPERAAAVFARSELDLPIADPFF